MAFLDALKQVFSGKQIASREKYRDALRKRDAKAALAAAAEAGIADGQVEKDVAIIDHAAELTKRLPEIAAAEKMLAETLAAAKAAQAEYDRVVPDLENQRWVTGNQWQAAAESARGLRGILDELEAVYLSAPDVLPIAEAPLEIRQRFESRARAEQNQKVKAEKLAVLNGLEQKVNAAQAEVRKIQNNPWPYNIADPEKQYGASYEYLFLKRNKYAAEAQKIADAAEKELTTARAAAGDI